MLFKIHNAQLYLLLITTNISTLYETFRTIKQKKTNRILIK